MSETLIKPGRNQFRCYHCRLIFPFKDGDWHRWESIEVHLCNGCEKLTKDKPERK